MSVFSWEKIHELVHKRNNGLWVPAIERFLDALQAVGLSTEAGLIDRMLSCLFDCDNINKLSTDILRELMRMWYISDTCETYEQTETRLKIEGILEYITT